MNSLPSASQMREPCPRAMKGGVPPTLRYARTGEFTPPGIDCCARSKSFFEILLIHATVSFRGTNQPKPKLPRISNKLPWRLRRRRPFKPM